MELREGAKVFDVTAFAGQGTSAEFKGHPGFTTSEGAYERFGEVRREAKPLVELWMTENEHGLGATGAEEVQRFADKLRANPSPLM